MIDFIWTIGFIGIIGYRIFNAGMNTKALFYVTREPYGRKSYTVMEGEKVFAYIAWTCAAALFWMLAIPVYGLFLLGKKYSKEA
jgi:hypothetical protein